MAACQPKTETTIVAEEESPNEYPELLSQTLEAHGGLDQWKEMKTLSFEIKKGEKVEKQLIDLENRKVLLTHPDYRLGYDGQEVWITDTAAFGKGSPRFYHNLIFYFFAMPYVLADDGIIYEEKASMILKGKTYDALAVSYEAGIGDAPKDEYIILVDPATKMMEGLLYTVTFFSNEKGKKFNALMYDNWETVNGLKVPGINRGYVYQGDSLAEMRYERSYENINLSNVKSDQSIFEIPEGAVIDSLKAQ
jgi:hypothetical protein